LSQAFMADDIKKAVDSVAELKKMLEEKLATIKTMEEKIKKLETQVNSLNEKLMVQRILLKHLAKKAVKEAHAPRPVSRISALRLKALRPRPRLENIYKSEEVRKKLEELRKKLREKRLSKAVTPRPEATTTPEPTGEDNDFREFVKKVLSGKATVSEMPTRFKVLPEVKEEGGDKK
jgi:chaperonin cofactor prefoldin